MLLVDSNVFIYARSRHQRSEACRALIAGAPGHPEWVVPGLVLLIQLLGSRGVMVPRETRRRVEK